LARFKIERGSAPLWARALIPATAIVITFLLTSLLLIWAKANPFSAYYQFLIAPLSSPFSAIEVLVKSTPLILTGAAVAFAFTAGYWNIGAEGQLYAGALAAAWLGSLLKSIHPAAGIPIMLVGGFVAGGLWASGPAFLKTKLNVDEVVTTLLLNSVMLYLISYLLNGPWRDPVSMWPQSPQIASGTIFFRLIPRTRLHLGFIISLAVILVEWFVLTQTPLGLRMRAIGKGKAAAQFAGIHVNRTLLTAALVSGGIAGLAGVGEVAGIHYHLIESISNNMGYSGILIATLGSLHPLAVGLAAIFFGLIDTGAQTVSRALNVPVYLGQVVQATLLLVTLALFVVQNYRIRKQ
jgi:ABC-type uncharacterized transport system permease subunit